MRAAVAAFVVVAIGGQAHADRRDFVGSAACGACHPAELAAWKATAHARASDRLGASPRRCFACHGTGEAPAGASYWPEVGCEACHGAGSAYAPDDVMRDPALARALGLRDVTAPAARAALCAACHRASTRLVPLDPSALRAPVHPSIPKSP